jgi:hypothetical protein
VRRVVVYFIIPPQTNGIYRNQKFGLKILKSMRGKAFGENISELIHSRNKFHLEILSKNSLTDEVKIHLNMFCSGMEDWVGGYGEGRHIITP